MRRLLSLVTLVAAASAAHGQFVPPWNMKEHEQAKPAAYVEDPFVTEYRQKFFAAMRGDSKTFNQAYADMEAMLKKDPKDARALVWRGNGKTIKAIRANMTGKKDEAGALAGRLAQGPRRRRRPAAERLQHLHDARGDPLRPSAVHPQRRDAPRELGKDPRRLQQAPARPAR